MKLGVYKHYKGGTYRLILIAFDANAEELTQVAVYVGLSDGRIWTRPLAEFQGYVDDGEWTTPRFRYVGEVAP